MSRLKAREVIARQGVAGSLVLMLRRYALLGWLLFFITAAWAGAFALVQIARPVPVLTLDSEGRLLGRIDYVDPLQRNDSELTADSLYFLTHYLSANSATIYDDAAIALSMMSEELRRSKLEQYKQTNQLQQIERADSSSQISFARTGQKKPQVIWRREGMAGIRIGGEIRLGEAISNPYFVELTVRLIPRTLDNNHGIEITDIRDI